MQTWLDCEPLLKNFTPICYTLFMAHTYWLAWEKFLKKNGLKPLAESLLVDARSLVILLSQVMVIGLPLVRSTAWYGGYQALFDTLTDSERLLAFSDFLTEAEG